MTDRVQQLKDDLKRLKERVDAVAPDTPILTCPHCLKRFHEPLKSDKFGDTELMGRVLHHPNGTLRLTHTHAAILRYLIRNRGGIEPEVLVNYIWSKSPQREFMDPGTVRVHICKMRRLMKGTGITISTAWYGGYKVIGEEK